MRADLQRYGDLIAVQDGTRYELAYACSPQAVRVCPRPLAAPEFTTLAQRRKYTACAV